MKRSKSSRNNEVGEVSKLVESYLNRLQHEACLREKNLLKEIDENELKQMNNDPNFSGIGMIKCDADTTQLLTIQRIARI